MNKSRRGFLRAGLSIVAASTGLPAVPAMAQNHPMGMDKMGGGKMDMGAPMTMPPPDAQAVLVFAAATVKPALDKVVGRYRDSGGGKVVVAYGASPTLAKQIENGAPADLFLSADVVWADYLADRKLIMPGMRADLLRNTLVLVGGAAAGDGKPTVIDRAFPLAQVVGRGPLAMCDPAGHPAGRYGKAGLENLGLWPAISGKIAIADNPQVAVAMVARGDAPAAVVFATDVRGVAGVHVLGAFPAASHPQIVYPVAVTTTGRHPADGERLFAFLKSPAAREVFDRYGYR